MHKMVRRNFFLPQADESFLKTLGNISVSEHIRRAIEEYILRHKPKNKATMTPSVVDILVCANCGLRADKEDTECRGCKKTPFKTEIKQVEGDNIV